MRKWLGLVAAAIMVGLGSTSASADQAVVVFKQSGCDYFIASGAKGLYVLEWYGGYDPSEGDVVTGGLSQYGFKDVYYPRLEREGRIYVDDYWLSTDSAIEKWKDHCS
uniref:hypothetical protein n=1 Tax=Cupriavidus yeoncheonensis TaxID=1462994 RepID=UPI003F491BCD